MAQRIKAAAVLLVLIVALFALIGCEKDADAILTIHDTKALKIEKQGAETRIYDREGGADYTITSHRQRIRKDDAAAHAQEAQTAADTDTVKIQTVYGVIIVTEKGTGETLYIR